jgi:hypothetical protein
VGVAALRQTSQRPRGQGQLLLRLLHVLHQVEQRLQYLRGHVGGVERRLQVVHEVVLRAVVELRPHRGEGGVEQRARQGKVFLSEHTAGTQRGGG